MRDTEDVLYEKLRKANTYEEWYEIARQLDV